MSVEHIIKPNGDQFWYMDGERHRIDGPAVIYANGDQEWWLNGMLHREDGPAIIYASGIQSWWVNDRLHREDGPAIITNHFVSYFNNGAKIKEEPYNIEIHEKYKFKNGGKTKAALREYPQ